jgi:uncharacterized protein YndB with AHSA1/START domain
MNKGMLPVASQITEKPSLSITRVFPAPPEQVWVAWTDPDVLKQWFGPDAGEVIVAKTDVRVGGRFHIVFHTLDGEAHDVGGAYREVKRPHKLVFTWAWKSTPEHFAPRAREPSSTCCMSSSSMLPHATAMKPGGPAPLRNSSVTCDSDSNNLSRCRSAPGA